MPLRKKADTHKMDMLLREKKHTKGFERRTEADEESGLMGCIGLDVVVKMKRQQVETGLCYPKAVS